jgi:hypothetical protein
MEPNDSNLTEVLANIDKQFSVAAIPKYLTVITVKEVSNGFVTELDEIVPRAGCGRRVVTVDSTIDGVAERLREYYQRRAEHDKATETLGDRPNHPDATGHYF